MYMYVHVPVCVLQILFSDQLNKRIYQVANGSSICTQLQFSPDTLKFQSSELDDAEMYGTYILGYDKKQRSVSGLHVLHVCTNL